MPAYLLATAIVLAALLAPAPAAAQPALTGVVKVAQGANHACALLASGAVKCWGSNSNGQLGLGTTGSAFASPRDVQSLGAHVIDITAGLNFTCVLLDSKDVRCWGQNNEGQLGDGTHTQRTSPVPVMGGVRAIGAGDRHMCVAVDPFGQGYCWGSNDGGQLGIGGIGGDQPTPHSLTATGGILLITGGAQHTCVSLQFGDLMCWGNNAAGQLGNGTNNFGLRETPLPFGDPFSYPITSLTAGGNTTCASRGDGTAACWGANPNGQFGNGTTNGSNAPVIIPGAFVQVALSSQHACGIHPDGSGACWGVGSDGQLGNRAFDSTMLPAEVVGLTGPAVQVTARGTSSCMRLASGGLQCWGSNLAGQLGINYVNVETVPVAVAIGSDTLTQIGASNIGSCGITPAGALKCWGANVGDGTALRRGVPTQVPGLESGVLAVDGGVGHTCALLAGGTVKCWGANASGQLGNATTTASTAPVDAAGVTGATALATGDNFSCAVTGGAVKCWGINTNGALGNGTAGGSNSTPGLVTGLTGTPILAIAAGATHACAITTARGLKCWGLNGSGQLGNGSNTNSATPVDVAGLSDVATVAAGPSHTCVTTLSGALHCWGGATFLGDGGASTNSPRLIAAGGYATVAAGSSGGTAFTCATLADFTVRCWGIGTTGQLGVNPAGTSSTPVTPVGLDLAQAPDIRQVAVAGTHACARRNNGQVLCWGGNSNGEVGNESFAGRYVATTVTALDTEPEAFTFPNVYDAPVFTLVTSAPVMVTGIAPNTAVTVSGGLSPGWSTDNVTFRTTGTINPGSLLYVRHRSANGTNLEQVTTVTVGSYSTTFTSRTPSGFFNLALTGPGTVTSTPAGIACPPDCDELFPANTMVTLTALPAGTTGNWGSDCAPGPSCTVNVLLPRTVTVTLTAPPAVAKGDFDGNGKADLLFRNADGRGAIWLMNGLSIASSAEIFPAGTNWSVAQIADLNGDGKADLVWANPDGRITVYLMDGTTATATQNLLPAGGGWSVAGAGDLNGDGKADIVFQNTDGTVAAYLMNGTTVTSGATILGSGTGWSVTLVADFDGDGKKDLFFTNTDGRAAIYLMNGLAPTATVEILNAGTGWTATHATDLNGDGKADIVWHNADGRTAVWLMNGTSVTSGSEILGAGTGWTVTRVGDFDGDGKSDLVFEHADGRVAIYLMNGITPTATTQILNAGGGWTVKRVADLNGDGKADIVWENVDGSLAIWLMNGTTTTSGAGVLGPGTGWRVSNASQGP